MGTNFIECNIEEDIDLKKWYRVKNLHDPISKEEPDSKKYVNNEVRNDIDFNGVKLEKR